MPTLSFEKRVKLASQFRGWMFLHPADINTIAELMNQYPFQSDEFSLLADAFVNTPLPEAQNRLYHIIEQYSTNREALRILLPKTAGSVMATPELLTGLLRMKIQSTNPDIASLSGLCMSNLLRNAKHELPALVDSFTAVLLKYSDERVTDDENSIQFMQEAGNTGDTIYLDRLLKYIRSTNPEMQEEALYAMRFMISTRVDSILAELVRKNPDSLHFKQIYEVMRMRFPSDHLRRTILKSIERNAVKNRSMCQELLEYLSNYIDEIPALAAELKSLHVPTAERSIVDGILKRYEMYMTFLRE